MNYNGLPVAQEVTMIATRLITRAVFAAGAIAFSLSALVDPPNPPPAHKLAG